MKRESWSDCDGMDVERAMAEAREKRITDWIGLGVLLPLVLVTVLLNLAYPSHQAYAEQAPSPLGDGVVVHAETPVVDEEVTVRVPTGFVMANAGTNQANERVVVRAPKAETVRIRWDSQSGDGGESSGPPNLLGRFERIMIHLGPGTVRVHVTVTYAGNRTKRVEKQFQVRGDEDPLD